MADHGVDSTRFIKFLELTLGPDHEETAVQLTELAMAYQDGENYDEAADLFQRILGIHEKNHGMDHPLTKQAKFNLKATQREIELQPDGSDEDSDDSDSDDSDDDYDTEGNSVEDEDSDEDSDTEEDVVSTEASTYAERARLHTAQRRRESKVKASGGGAGGLEVVTGVAAGGGDEEDGGGIITEVYDPNTKSTYFQSQRTGQIAWSRDELLDDGEAIPAKAPAAPIEPMRGDKAASKVASEKGTLESKKKLRKGAEQNTGKKRGDRSVRASKGDEQTVAKSKPSERSARTTKASVPGQLGAAVGKTRGERAGKGGEQIKTGKGGLGGQQNNSGKGGTQTSAEKKRAERMTPLQQYNQKRSLSTASESEDAVEAAIEDGADYRPKSTA
jgi:hypothetical protein